MRSIPNELSARFGEIEVRKQIMAEYGDSDTAFLGENADGETVEMSVYKDKIIVKTYQNNGWVRVDHYDSDGCYEAEMYEGKWK